MPPVPKNAADSKKKVRRLNSVVAGGQHENANLSSLEVPVDVLAQPIKKRRGRPPNYATVIVIPY
jgi:predicted kinase